MLISSFQLTLSLIYRNFVPDDLEAVAELEKSAFPVGPYTKAMLKRIFRMRESFNIIAEEGGKIVGYIIAIPLDGESADIESIAVHPDFQRTGLGTKLMAMMEKEILKRGFSATILEVRDMNTEAISFYKKHGYTIISHMPTYYKEYFRGSRGAYRMIKKVSASVVKSGD